MKLIKTLAVLPLVLASVGMVALLGLAGWGCYPKNCDPKTDPLKCECPPGPCGDYPGHALADAGRDG